MARLFKALLTLCVGGLAGLYAIQNIVNLQAAHGFVALMLAQGGETLAYSNSVLPAINSPAIAWIVLFIILAGELLAAVLALFGAFRLFTAGSPDAFKRAKPLAIAGAGVGVFVWFGFFGVIGGAGLQMWQTAAGASALGGAFEYAVLCFLTLIFVAQPED